ncbi:MAG: hypothetical protein VKQ33_00395 [Candidatus Sericytochromatia bacterium]|nr:hypothetical protein [Candidatus Sericytochromatia bacterium]
MHDDLLSQFAATLRDRWLKDLITEELTALRQLDLPMIQMLAMMPQEKATAWLSEREAEWLTAIAEGRGLEWEVQRLQRWEQDDIPGIPKGALHPADVPLFHAAQRAALQRFVGRFSRDPKVKVELLAAIEGHFQPYFAAALRTYQRMVVQRAG